MTRWEETQVMNLEELANHMLESAPLRERQGRWAMVIVVQNGPQSGDPNVVAIGTGDSPNVTAAIFRRLAEEYEKAAAGEDFRREFDVQVRRGPKG